MIAYLDITKWLGLMVVSQLLMVGLPVWMVMEKKAATNKIVGKDNMVIINPDKQREEMHLHENNTLDQLKLDLKWSSLNTIICNKH